MDTIDELVSRDTALATCLEAALLHARDVPTGAGSCLDFAGEYTGGVALAAYAATRLGYAKAGYRGGRYTPTTHTNPYKVGL